jgi:hypothetical protein
VAPVAAAVVSAAAVPAAAASAEPADLIAAPETMAAAINNDKPNLLNILLFILYICFL